MGRDRLCRITENLSLNTTLKTKGQNMRWASTELVAGETRNRKIFLFFPKTLRGETRWLETAVIVEMYSHHSKWSSLKFEDQP